MPNPTVGLIGASIGGSVVQAGAASRAAKAQASAATQQGQAALQGQEMALNFLSPYRNAGIPAMGAAQYEMGLGPRPMVGGTPLEVETFSAGSHLDGWSNDFDRYRVGGRVFTSQNEADEYARANATGGTPYQGFQASPGYQHALQQGLDAVESSRAAQGSLYSGATTQAVLEHGIGTQNQEYGNFFSRLMGLAGVGANAAAGSGSAVQQGTQQQINALGNYGNAQAAGAIGVGNALNSGISNGIGLWQYQNQLGGIK